MHQIEAFFYLIGEFSGLGRGPAGSVPMDEWQSKQVLAGYGVQFPKAWAGPWQEAASAADAIGFPVVLKVLSKHLSHKTQVGGVRLSLHSTDDVFDAVGTIKDNLSRAAPALLFSHVLVEQMVEGGVMELLIGVKRHPGLGAALVVGRGGTVVESLRSYALALLPATERELRGAVAKLNLELEPRAMVNLLAMLRCVEAYALDHLDELAELDINPVIVRADASMVAVDALVIVGPV